MYQLAADGSTGNDTYLRAIDFTSNPIGLTNIGPGAGALVNGAYGYNEVDNYIYGIAFEQASIGAVDEYQMYRVGADGSFRNLGNVTGLPGGLTLNVGDVLPDGRLIAKAKDNNSPFYIIDLTVDPLTVSAIITPPSSTATNADWAYNPADGLLYTIHQGSDTVVSINPADGTRTILTAPTFNSNYGAQWFDNKGNYYIFDSLTGDYSLVNLASGTMVRLGTGLPTSDNDAASCRGPAPIVVRDYSDAPFAETTHDIGGNLQLGADVDAESASIANADASGDGADDDGVSAFPTLMRYASSYTIPAANINASGDGVLHGWVDFNRNGAFDADEHTQVSVTGGTLSGDMIWSGISTPTEGGTFARFRLTTTSLTDDGSTPALDERATSPAADGEVEDYALTIGTFIPVCDATIASDFSTVGTASVNGLNELVTTVNAINEIGAAWSNRKISLNEPFALEFAFNTGNRDESLTRLGGDGMAFAFHDDPAGINALGGNGGNLGVTGMAPHVATKFDTFDNPTVGVTNRDFTAIFTDKAQLTPTQYVGELEDGQWHAVTINWDPATQLLVYTLDGVQLESITRDLINADFGGDQFVHYGFSGATGGAYNIQKGCVITAPPPVDLDYSDAPVSYGQVSHAVTSGLYLGAGVDIDTTSLMSANADGDDLDGTDDEDGVSAFPMLTTGVSAYTIPAANITAVGDGVLHAWIDFDENGAFTVDEYASVTVTGGSLSSDLSWSGVTTGAAGTTFARFRLTTTVLTDDAGTAALDERATNGANDGEVEDYAITVNSSVGSCALTSGTTFTTATFTGISPANTLTTQYRLTTNATVNSKGVDVLVTMDAPPNNTSSSWPYPEINAGKFRVVQKDANLALNYQFVETGTTTPVTANWRVRIGDLDNDERLIVDTDQFHSLVVNAPTNLTFNTSGNTVTVIGSSTNDNYMPEDTVEFDLSISHLLP
ncbi:MAG: L-type lectin-domain containing protein [Thiolinea sp.]